MATTATYTATMRTKKTTSSSNHNSSAAMQEYYTNDYNLVGIVCFSGMALQNKVISKMILTVSSAGAGYGAGSTKTVYVRKSRYQTVSQSGVTGLNYTGDALGTFNGSFYNNTSQITFDDSHNAALFAALAQYFQEGNNTFTIYNPSPVQGSSSTYSKNYLKWDSATLTVTYEEGVSQPTVSSTSVNMGSAVTITTNRLSSGATHTLTYAIGGSTGTIATSVGASYAWTPPLSLASLIPSATSCACTITCTTYYNGNAVGSRTCSLTLNVPASVVPTISTLTISEAVSGIATQFACYVQGKSKLSVSIGAAGARGSTISSYRATLNGTAYTSATFTTGLLNFSGSQTLSVTVTDSRGRTGTTTRTITVQPYTVPSISNLKAERCNSAGTAAQTDGTKVRVTTAGSISSVNAKNTCSCKLYYKLSTATAWTLATNLTAVDYAFSSTNLLLSATFNVLNSYDIKVSLTDFFTTVEQIVSVGTKQVMMDFYRDGTGIAFGKVAESTGKAEFGWPLKLSSPLGLDQGGTGAATAAAARNNLGLGNTTGAVPIANGGTGATTAAAARNALGLGNTTGAVPVANGGTGATTAAAARTNLGITVANIGAAASSHNHAAGNITSGTIDAARLPFKVQYGSTTVTGVSWTSVTLSGFTAKPIIVVSYANNAATSGINVLKTQSESKTGFQVCMAGSSGSGTRTVNWIAIGT